ncbi:hypothetical protein F0562_014599 [Nyssa sinensis]|uniref:Uncharacterized protein n=1 Tax=Nyssa sinensis TaxID=561372 RepID=A0A5J4ZN81_9ASTE|nr:hypothetical protein F0562_014599 [Nyssa sinensis]
MLNKRQIAKLFLEFMSKFFCSTRSVKLALVLHHIRKDEANVHPTVVNVHMIGKRCIKESTSALCDDLITWISYDVGFLFQVWKFGTTEIG